MAIHSSEHQTEQSLVRLEISLGTEVVQVLCSREVAILAGVHDGCEPIILLMIQVQLVAVQE